jgi:hypothetical protein
VTRGEANNNLEILEDILNSFVNRKRAWCFLVAGDVANAGFTIRR